MALEFSFNTQTTTNSGTKLDLAYARLQVTLLPDEANAVIRLDLYESSTAFMNNRSTIILDEIPSELHQFTAPITPVNYANLDMTNIHNQMRQILLIGASSNNFPPIATNPNWGGLESIDPSNAITVTMPS